MGGITDGEVWVASVGGITDGEVWVALLMVKCGWHY